VNGKQGRNCEKENIRENGEMMSNISRLLRAWMRKMLNFNFLLLSGPLLLLLFGEKKAKKIPNTRTQIIFKSNIAKNSPTLGYQTTHEIAKLR
jgi:hypothetical protein